MNLPPEFISIITNTYGEDGEQLIANLPALIEDASQRWGLRNVQPVPNLSYNFVAFANRDNQDVVLKIGVPHDGLRSEIATLRLFCGEGACQLLEADEEKGFLLLERLHPGLMLSTLEDDEAATHIAAEVMKKIWRSPALPGTCARGKCAPHLSLTVRCQGGASVDYGATNTPLRSARAEFILLSDWFDGLNDLRAMFEGGTGPLDEKLVARTEQAVKDFLVENHMPILMHGDFHHFNILSSERGWLVIDPKGLIGPAGYEVGPFMINPWGSLSDGVSNRLLLRRVDILHEHLGWERERILEWSLAHGILSAWWGIEDNTGWDYALSFARMIAKLPL
jgi:streptomycin 6-kinase